jgi:hypothetical protein
MAQFRYSPTAKRWIRGLNAILGSLATAVGTSLGLATDIPVVWHFVTFALVFVTSVIVIDRWTQKFAIPFLEDLSTLVMRRK